ncbi:uncharacterized protein TRAVEDRAFT_167141 [Trametes versicolor FP-101664 SS1]|uniref:uncharacterized protein n=1 Tax=Trametes versicolor (strain FP-101664) TaxID=717944 RepID=UPI0004621FD6|nr:uncharacterized protein TRAVEDRAFT_167141 [Trametes versicolor FP-101664 SS1]EIW59662.1 hypothetical protein TRAVEDRAFT_167141 [Trametes versicolor FP-101664 SS1]
MSTSTETTLSSLLSSSPYLLAYALPLLFLSLLLTFAGAFLTLDRTRAFAPRYDALHSPETTKVQHAEAVVKRIFRLEGGIGGIAVGYVFGVHFTTFLSLLIPNVTSDSPLTPGAFVAVWMLSGIICAIVAARWKHAALGFAGLSGYSTLALALAVIVHPSLLTRHVLVAVFMPIGLLMCLLPIARTQHVFVRVGMASAGSFGTILAIALLAHLSAWSDVWGRLWIHDGSEWGTAKEKGLSAAFCLFLVVGTASDWFLKVKLGENPDEKWDSYLAEYASTLPNASDRAGTFQPLQSFWARHFGHGGTDPIHKDIIFPADVDLKRPIPDSPLKLYKKTSFARPHSPTQSPRRFTPPQELLRKDRKPVLARGRTRELVKFDPLDPYTLSDSDDDDDLKKAVPAFVRSPTRTDSMATFTNDGPVPVKGQEGARRVRLDTLSDDEEDVTSGVAHERTVAHNGKNWSPDFIRRHSQRQLGHKQSTAGFSQAASSNGTGSSATLAPATFVPLPATPSLIKAVERVNAAQQEAFASQAARSTDGLPMPSPLASAGPTPPQGHAQGRHWDSFWHEVKTKAGHGFHHRQDIGGEMRDDSGSGSKR